MNELSRIFGRKAVFLLAAAVILNAALFAFSCNTDRDVTLVGEALDEYIADYPDFIASAVSEGKALSSVGIYGSGFASDNIKTSAEAYGKLTGISPEAQDNRGIVMLLQYRLSDLFLLAFPMLLSIAFLAERRKGLVWLVRSAAKGRGALYLRRVGILAAASFAGTLLFYGGDYLVMLAVCGPGGLGRAIQSLPEYQMCPYGISIGGCMLFSALIRASACFVSAMAFYLLISLLGTASAYTAAALTAAAEILLYLLVIPSSSLNGLKYVNLFAAVRCEDYFRYCRNLNIFGKAVPAIQCAAVFLLLAAVLLTAAGYVVHGKLHPVSGNFLERFQDRLAAAAEKFAVGRSLFGWESFKLLIMQGGLFFIAAAFFLTLSAELKYGYIYPTDPYEIEWYEKYYGEITEEILSKAEADKLSLDNSIDRLQKRIDEMIASGNTMDESYGRLLSMLNEAINRRNGLAPILENIRDGVEYTNRTGNRIMLIVPYAYELLLKYDKKTAEQAWLYILTAVIASVSGVFAYDRQNNMQGAIRSAKRGRGVCSAAKTGSVLLICVFTCLMIHAVQLVLIGKILGYNDLSAPVQSLEFMRDFGLYVPIYGYFIIIFSARAAISCAAGLVCSAVSRLCPDNCSAMGASAFVIFAAAVLLRM